MSNANPAPAVAGRASLQNKCYIIGEFLYPNGGAPMARLLNMARALSDLEWSPALWSLSRQYFDRSFGPVADVPEGLSVQVWRSRSGDNRARSGVLGKIGWLLSNAIGAMQIAGKLRMESHPLPGDLIILYSRSFSRLWPIIRAARSANLKIVLDVTEGVERFHGTLGKLNPVYWDWWLGAKFLPGMVDTVSTISYGLADRYRDAGATNVVVVPAIEEWPAVPPVIETKLDHSLPMRLVVFGSLSVKDAPQTLLEVLKLLQKWNAPVQIELVGRYMDDEVGRGWAKELSAIPGIKPWLILRGAPEPGQLSGVLSAADGFLMLRSDSEAERLAFPTRLVEILRHAKPVLVSDVGDVSAHLCDGEHAILLAPNDATSIAERMTALAGSADRGRTLGIQGWYRAKERFDRQSHLAKLLDACGLVSRLSVKSQG